MAEQWQEEICYWEGCAFSCRIRRIPGSVPVVFLPGAGECQTRWEGQFEALEDHTVLTLDWRLHGNSQPYTLSGRPIEIKPFSIPQAVKDLRQILRQSELCQSVLVIGAGGGTLLQKYQAQFQDALGYGVVGEEEVDGLESLPPTQSALLEFVARCTPPPPAPVPPLTVWEQLAYWDMGLESGLFPLSEVEEELDRMLEEEIPPLPLVEVAWQVTKGYTPFFHAMEEALFRQSWDEEKVLQAILERARKKWQSGQWELQEAASFLSQLELPESRTLDYWLELLDIGYGEEEALLDLVLRTLHLPPELGPKGRQEE